MNQLKSLAGPHIDQIRMSLNFNVNRLVALHQSIDWLENLILNQKKENSMLAHRLRETMAVGQNGITRHDELAGAFIERRKSDVPTSIGLKHGYNASAHEDADKFKRMDQRIDGLEAHILRLESFVRESLTALLDKSPKKQDNILSPRSIPSGTGIDGEFQPLTELSNGMRRRSVGENKTADTDESFLRFLKQHPIGENGFVTDGENIHSAHPQESTTVPAESLNTRKKLDPLKPSFVPSSSMSSSSAKTEYESTSMLSTISKTRADIGSPESLLPKAEDSLSALMEPSAHLDPLIKSGQGLKEETIVEPDLFDNKTDKAVDVSMESVVEEAGSLQEQVAGRSIRTTVVRSDIPTAPSESIEEAFCKESPIPASEKPEVPKVEENFQETAPKESGKTSKALSKPLELVDDLMEFSDNSPRSTPTYDAQSFVNKWISNFNSFEKRWEELSMGTKHRDTKGTTFQKEEPEAIADGNESPTLKKTKQCDAHSLTDSEPEETSGEEEDAEEEEGDDDEDEKEDSSEPGTHKKYPNEQDLRGIFFDLSNAWPQKWAHLHPNSRVAKYAVPKFPSTMNPHDEDSVTQHVLKLPPPSPVREIAYQAWGKDIWRLVRRNDQIRWVLLDKYVAEKWD